MQYFEYLGEKISQNWLNKKSIESRAQKVELVFQLTKDKFKNSKKNHYNGTKKISITKP